METDYDVILLGTGLTESILGCTLASLGYKILHLDRNAFYGNENGSLNLEQLFEHFGRKMSESVLAHENPNAYNMDLTAKVLLADDALVRLMNKMISERYGIDFEVLDASFMMRDGYFHKVPCNEMEALSSSLMGFFEKRRAAKFFSLCNKHSLLEKTEKMQMPMSKLFDEFGLGKGTIQFIGHAVALYSSDEYLTRPAEETLKRCRLYSDSLLQGCRSPYIYPHYGVGELPYFFNRLGAVHGGTYCLRAQVNKAHFRDKTFEGVDFTIEGNDGNTQTHHVTAKWLIANSLYIPDSHDSTFTVLRCICITDASLPQAQSGELGSHQLIIPGSELKRREDVFILQFSCRQKVVPPGKFAVYISTVLEEEECHEVLIDAITDLIGCIFLERFVRTLECHRVRNNQRSNVLITKALDSTSHFESIVSDVEKGLAMIHGKSIADAFA